MRPLMKKLLSMALLLPSALGSKQEASSSLEKRREAWTNVADTIHKVHKGELPNPDGKLYEVLKEHAEQIPFKQLLLLKSVLNEQKHLSEFYLALLNVSAKYRRNVYDELRKRKELLEMPMGSVNIGRHYNFFPQWFDLAQIKTDCNGNEFQTIVPVLKQQNVAFLRDKNSPDVFATTIFHAKVLSDDFLHKLIRSQLEQRLGNGPGSIIMNFLFGNPVYNDLLDVFAHPNLDPYQTYQYISQHSISLNQNQIQNYRQDGDQKEIEQYFKDIVERTKFYKVHEKCNKIVKE